MFKIGDTVRVNVGHGVMVWAIIRAEHNGWLQVESLNPDSMEAMGHRKWVKKISVVSAS